MRSLNTGFEEMCSLLSDFDFDVLGVTETWLEPSIPSDSFEIPGYTLLRADRSNQAHHALPSKGGGVAMYIRDIFQFQTFQLSDVDSGIEHLTVILKIRGGSVGLVVVYKPPCVNYTCLTSLLHASFIELASEVMSVICLGDFNIDLLSSTNNDAKYMRRLLKAYNTIQHVNEPTRVTANTATLIDHIIAEKCVEIERCGVVDASSILDERGIHITDHKLVYCCLKKQAQKKEANFITYRDFKNFNIDAALIDVRNVDWESAKDIQGVDNINSFICGNIKNIFDKHAPVVSKKVTKKKAPWRNEEIIYLNKIKNKLRNKYWKSRNREDWANYKALRNRLNSKMRIAKRQYFGNRLTNCKDSKEFWRCLRQGDVIKTQHCGRLPADLDVREVNDHFVKMGSFYREDEDLVRYYGMNKMIGLTNTFEFEAVTENEVISAMNEISSKAVGSDGISIEMIKAVSPYAIGVITHLINESLTTATFPSAWKESVVRPLPKIKCPTSLNDLRPISILPAMSKVLEKIAVRQISRFVEDQQVLPKLQSGFRRNHSTCTALTNMFADIFKERDSGRCSTVILLDYSQAFDSISHRLLTAKLSYFGFLDSATQWLVSYLVDRTQVTKLGTEMSAPLVKPRGVPQGSCLGPLLYTLYTADLANCVQHCNIHAYADDCQLHLAYDPNSVELAIRELNVDLERIRAWSVRHGLKLNISKCGALHVAGPEVTQRLHVADLQVVIDGEIVHVHETVKTLGVMLDKGLTFSDHVSYAMQKALGRLRNLQRYRSVLPETAKLKIVQSMVLSVFYYCLPAYGNSISRGDIDRIQRLQNSAVRFVFNLRKRDHVSPYREAANLLPMEAVCKMQTLCMIHRILTLAEPQYLTERLVSRGEVSGRNTRHEAQLHFPRVRLEVGRKGFNYFGPRLYNGLPNSFKQLKSGSFRKRIKELVNVH